MLTVWEDTGAMPNDGLSHAELAILRNLDASTPRSASELGTTNNGDLGGLDLGGIVTIGGLDTQALVTVLQTLAGRGYAQAQPPGGAIEPWDIRYVLTPEGEAVVDANA